MQMSLKQKLKMNLVDEVKLARSILDRQLSEDPEDHHRIEGISQWLSNVIGELDEMVEWLEDYNTYDPG